MNSLHSPILQFNNAFNRLQQRWEETKNQWNDKVARDFENNHWTPLESQVQATLQEMQHLAEIIAKAQRSVK